MPITKSAQKALRQSKRRKAQNLKRAKTLKDEIKALKKALAKKDKKEAAVQLIKVYKALDKAAKTNVIKRGRAARLKSRLAKVVNKS